MWIPIQINWRPDSKQMILKLAHQRIILYLMGISQTFICNGNQVLLSHNGPEIFHLPFLQSTYDWIASKSTNMNFNTLYMRTFSYLWLFITFSPSLALRKITISHPITYLKTAIGHNNGNCWRSEGILKIIIELRFNSDRIIMETEHRNRNEQRICIIFSIMHNISV